MQKCQTHPLVNELPRTRHLKFSITPQCLFIESSFTGRILIRALQSEDTGALVGNFTEIIYRCVQCSSFQIGMGGTPHAELHNRAAVAMSQKFFIP